MASDRSSWLGRARALRPRLVRWRAALHGEPELAHHEERTRALVVGALEGIGLTPRTYGARFHGVLAEIRGRRPGPVVALRADMDGLPITEATGLKYASRRPGVMHACGHDVHMTSLLGAAAMLADRRDELAGTYKLLFQPAEEEGTPGGAGLFLARGCFDRPRVDYVVGQHVEPTLPAGTVGWRIGAMMAAVDDFTIEVRGAPGHAATPQTGADAVLVAAEIVVGLQSLVSRARDPVDPAVLSVGAVHGGTAVNVRPASVTLLATLRTVRPESRLRLRALLVRRVKALASSSGATVRLTPRWGPPALINDGPATAAVVEALGAEFGAERLREIAHPWMGGEDFARYLERVPGTFLQLGVGRPAPTIGLHDPRFAPPEAVLPVGAAALAAAAVGLADRAP